MVPRTEFRLSRKNWTVNYSYMIFVPCIELPDPLFKGGGGTVNKILIFRGWEIAKELLK